MHLSTCIRNAPYPVQVSAETRGQGCQLGNCGGRIALPSKEKGQPRKAALLGISFSVLLRYRRKQIGMQQRLELAVVGLKLQLQQ